MIKTRPGWEVKVFPMVVGCLGTVAGMGTGLENLHITRMSLIKELQMEAQ